MEITTEHVEFSVPDISRGHCVATIERCFDNVPGVARVAADAGTRRVEIDFDPNRVSRDQIVTTLDALGFPVANAAS